MGLIVGNFRSDPQKSPQRCKKLGDNFNVGNGRILRFYPPNNTPQTVVRLGVF